MVSNGNLYVRRVIIISNVDVTAATKSVIPVFRQWPINRPSLIASKLTAITVGSIVSGEFSNKVAVVTGGSRGIGREIAADLARAGTQTVIVCLRRPKISRRGRVETR